MCDEIQTESVSHNGPLAHGPCTDPACHADQLEPITRLSIPLIPVDPACHADQSRIRLGRIDLSHRTDLPEHHPATIMLLVSPPQV